MTHRSRTDPLINALKRVSFGFILGIICATTSLAETVLRVAVQTLPAALGNVHRSTSSSELYSWAAMFDPLTMVGSDAVVRPWLMEDWEAVNPTTWHFRLRPDVVFHNGEPFDADAVVNTLTYSYVQGGPAGISLPCGQFDIGRAHFRSLKC